MGELADAISAMCVRASTPDGAITAELRNRDQLSLTFLQGWYQLCDDGDLERRLPTLASMLWVARTREYWRTFSAVTGQEVSSEDRAISKRDIAWREERDNLTARGWSTDGRIAIKAVGMRQWVVELAPGTVRALNEEQFAVAVGEAARELIQDQSDQIAALTHKHYGDDR